MKKFRDTKTSEIQITQVFERDNLTYTNKKLKI